MISLGKLPVQAEERGGCREALGGDGYVTPQELMGGKQEPMGGKREHFASCGTSGLKRLWHVSSAFPAPCRVLQQQTAPPEAAGLQWSLLATPLASPGGQSWEREAALGFCSAPRGSLCPTQLHCAGVCTVVAVLVLPSHKSFPDMGKRLGPAPVRLSLSSVNAQVHNVDGR